MVTALLLGAWISLHGRAVSMPFTVLGWNQLENIASVEVPSDR